MATTALLTLLAKTDPAGGRDGLWLVLLGAAISLTGTITWSRHEARRDRRVRVLVLAAQIEDALVPQTLGWDGPELPDEVRLHIMELTALAGIGDRVDRQHVKGIAYEHYELQKLLRSAAPPNGTPPKEVLDAWRRSVQHFVSSLVRPLGQHQKTRLKLPVGPGVRPKHNFN